MRSAGQFSLIPIGDKVFAPRGGISLGGTSTAASLQTNHIIRTLRSFEKQVQANPAEIADLIRSRGYEPGSLPTFKFALLQDGGFEVVETVSGCAIGLR